MVVLAAKGITLRMKYKASICLFTTTFTQLLACSSSEEDIFRISDPTCTDGSSKRRTSFSKGSF